MSTIIANINFLASLGITTQEQFEEAFGDMETFDSYCQELGYTWEIDENNDIILTSSKGKTVDSQVSVLVTAQPEFVITEGSDSYTIEAVGEGTVKLYAEDTEVSNPCVIERTSESQVITFTATAQEDGKIISEEAEEEIEIPAISATPMPEIDYTTGDTSYVITATGQGEIKLYADGVLSDTGDGSATFAVARTNVDQTIVFTATAQVGGMEISATAEEEITVLALPMSTAPVITSVQQADRYEVTVTAGQNANIVITCGGETMANPFSIMRGNSDTTMSVVATATEPNHQPTTTTETLTILALPVTATPSLSGVTNDTNCVITATGSGEVKLYADGVLSDTGDGSATFAVNRGNTSQTIVFTATAQESNHQISATATLNFEVQALPVTATPSISYVENTNDVTITATGTGTSEVKLYIDGTLANTGTGTATTTVNKTTSAQTVTATATAQEPNKQISATATQSVSVPAMLLDYMKLTSAGNGNITIDIPADIDSTCATSLSYSKDGSNWSDTTIDNTAQTITIPVQTNDVVYLKGIATQWGKANGYSAPFKTRIGDNMSSVDFSVSGNIMSLLYGDNFENQTSLPSGSTHTFAGLFSFTTCSNASQLTLPATTLVANCYALMFENSRLTSAPALPATTLAQSCYASMFVSCQRLTSAPALPATTLANYCYQTMFRGCSGLTSAPTLPATTLAQSCYRGMFQSCSGLTSAPALPATTLAQYCYCEMFQSCSGLTSAPTLPATTLANYCYQTMFKGCSSLTSAPTLPATTAAQYCYKEMFQGCTSLTSAPTLPATTLARNCYDSMFQGCTSLTTSPELPATTLTSECYSTMFKDCTSLNSITMLATSIGDTYTRYNWVQNVAATGTFTKAAAMTTLPTGNNGIPSGWTVVNHGLNFSSSTYTINENDGANSAYVSVKNNGVDVTSSCTFSSTDADNDGEDDIDVSYIIASDVEQEDPEDPGTMITPSWFVNDGYYASWVGDGSTDGSATLTATYNGDTCTATVTYVAYVEPEEPEEPEEEPEP